MTARPQDVALQLLTLAQGVDVFLTREEGALLRQASAALASAQAREEELRRHIDNLEGTAHKRSKEIEALGDAVHHHASRAERLEEALRTTVDLLEIWRGWTPDYCTAYRDFESLPEIQAARAVLSTNAAQPGETT